jgi:hypothetical protein
VDIVLTAIITATFAVLVFTYVLEAVINWWHRIPYSNPPKIEKPIHTPEIKKQVVLPDDDFFQEFGFDELDALPSIDDSSYDS